jgi:hypothetical protein
MVSNAMLAFLRCSLFEHHHVAFVRRKLGGSATKLAIK